MDQVKWPSILQRTVPEGRHPPTASGYGISDTRFYHWRNAWVPSFLCSQQSILDLLCPQIRKSYRVRGVSLVLWSSRREAQSWAKLEGNNFIPGSYPKHDPTQLPEPTCPLYRLYKWVSLSSSSFLRFRKRGLYHMTFGAPQQ